MIAGIIMVALLWMIAFWYNRPANLAKRFFYPLSEELVRARSGDATAMLWMNAYDDFQKNSFNAAEKKYQQLSANPDDALHPYIQWNILLCRLAEDGVSVEWRYQLDEYIAFADGPLKEKAIRMRTYLNSWIYKLSRFQFSPEFSSLKPRLI